MANRSLPLAALLSFLAACGATGTVSTEPSPADAVAAEAPRDVGAPDVATTDAPTLPDACGPVVLTAARSDFLFLVDTSSSWSTSSRIDRFEGARDALGALLPSLGLAGSGRAATFFPRLASGDASCASDAYASLDLAWDAPASAFDERLNAVTFAGDSALGPALHGAISIARERFEDGSQRTVSIVVVTDATPGSDEACTSWSGVADVAADGFAHGRGRSVHTHVVSVLGSAVAPEHPVTIGAIATRGGGFAAYVNGSREDVKSSTRNALANIVDRMNGCTFALPRGVAPHHVTIDFAGSPPETATRVDSADACMGNAFHLDDETNPTTLTLCSGEAGVGGLCERTFVRARSEGAPRVTADTCGG